MQPDRLPNTGKQWTEREDAFLASYGDIFSSPGYFVAEHDLGRDGKIGVRRLKWLKKYRPEFVAKYTDEVNTDVG